MPWPGGQVAALAERSGIAAVCTGDFVDNDAYSVLAEMVDRTSTAQVGTGIAYAFARTPYAHAAAIRTLHSKASGRLFLGLGAGARTINRDWFGVQPDHPVGRMVDLAGATRAWLQAGEGSRVKYDGHYYHIDAKVQAPVLGRLDVPILFAAFNTRMAAAAARHADGLIGHGLFTASWWDNIVRPVVDRAAAESERDAWAEHGWLITAVDDDNPNRAVLDARRMIGFYLTVRTYDPFIAHHGWTRSVDNVREAFARGDMDRFTAAVSDDMVEAIAVCGNTSQARSQLARRLAEGSVARDLVYLAAPSFLVSARRKARYAANSLALLSDG